MIGLKPSTAENPFHAHNLASLPTYSNPLAFPLALSHFKSRSPIELRNLKKCSIQSSLDLNSDIFQENGGHINRKGKQSANTCPFSPLDFLERAAVVYGNGPSIVYNETTYTWSETHTRCLKMASSIASLGTKKGEVVSVLAPNIPAMYELQFAVPMSGAILNNINFRLDARTLSVLLLHSEAKLVFVDYQGSSSVVEAISLFPPNLQQPKLVLIKDDQNKNSSNILNDQFHNSYENMIDEGDQDFN